MVVDLSEGRIFLGSIATLLAQLGKSGNAPSGYYPALRTALLPPSEGINKVRMDAVEGVAWSSPLTAFGEIAFGI